MLRRASGWVDDRLGASSFARDVLNKVFPDHWSFMIGEIALYSFVILVLTGTFLTFFFDASSVEVTYQGSYAPLRGVRMSEAYASVLELSFDVELGLFMRQIHHWAALVFVGAIVLHLCRIFFTGAFRRPREINWIIGVTLLILAIFNGFTGYSLPDDLLSGTGLRIAYSVALSIPFLGPVLASLVFGGEFPANEIISRLFVTHILLVPGLIAVLIAAHLGIMWRQKHTQFPGRGRTETNVVGSKLWPTYAAKSIGLLLLLTAVLAALGGLFQINPVWLYGPFEPYSVSAPAQPDWYLGWLEGALRLFPPWEIRVGSFMLPNPFFPAVLLPGVTFLGLYLWPFLEARFTGDREPHELLDRPRDRPLRSALGAATLAFYGVLFFAGSNDILADRFEVSVGAVTLTFQILVFVLPLVVGLFVHRVLRAVAAAEAENVWHISFRQFLRPRRGSVKESR
jgi:ubiquinol-cytochrome c reductase cytochrome b subunit